MRNEQADHGPDFDPFFTTRMWGGVPPWLIDSPWNRQPEWRIIHVYSDREKGRPSESTCPGGRRAGRPGSPAMKKCPWRRWGGAGRRRRRIDSRDDTDDAGKASLHGADRKNAWRGLAADRRTCRASPSAHHRRDHAQMAGTCRQVPAVRRVNACSCPATSNVIVHQGVLDRGCT